MYIYAYVYMGMYTYKYVHFKYQRIICLRGKNVHTVNRKLPIKCLGC